MREPGEHSETAPDSRALSTSVFSGEDQRNTRAIDRPFWVHLYKGGAVIRPSGQKMVAQRPADSTRGKIETLSYRSRQRLAFCAANSEVEFRSMITLTYRKGVDPGDGETVKRHLDRALKRLKRQGGEYLWFLEFMKNDAPHVHILTDIEVESDRYYCKRSKRWRVFDRERTSDWSKYWAKVAGAGDELMSRASARVEPILKKDGAARYVAKYSYKTEQKSVPESFQDVGRFWSCSRAVTPKLVCDPFIIFKLQPGEWSGKGDQPFKNQFEVSERIRRVGLQNPQWSPSFVPVDRREWQQERLPLFRENT